MRFKLVSKDGDFLPMLSRLQQEGHEVMAYIESDRAQKMYDGILPKVSGPLELDIGFDDIVLFDMVGGGASADTLKQKGYKVIGGGGFNDMIELDRRAGDYFMNEHGLKTPESMAFYDFESARQFLFENPKRYVFKPNGNLDTDLTYVSRSTEDMIRMLPYLEKRCPDNIGFELQEYIDGIEMSTEAWFNGREFLLPLNSTMEEKPLMVGDIGPNTGCMGNVVWWWPEDVSQILVDSLFRGMEGALREEGYVGPLDINAIWTPEGPYALEFTARFGYDAIQASSRLIALPFGEFLAGLEGMSAIPTIEGYAVAVRVSIPPYPHEGDVPDVPVGGIGEDNRDEVYLSDVQNTPEGFLCAGADGYVLSVAANSQRLSQAISRAYQVIDGLIIPNMQYRLDVGERVAAERPVIERYIKKLVTTNI